MAAADGNQSLVDDGVEPLAGLSVLEVSGRVAGAYCGHLLAELGASVDRIDVPTIADVAAHAADGLYASLHVRKHPVDVESVERKLSESGYDAAIIDVELDDPGGVLGTEVARLISPDLLGATPKVSIALHDSGAVGEPLATPATSLTVSAHAAMSWAIGSPGRVPLTLPFDLPEYLVGTEAAGLAITALLSAPTSSAKWSVVATDVLTSYVGTISSNFINYGRAWRRDGARATESGGSYPAAMFPAKDGHVSIMCRTPREWEALLKAMGDPPWADCAELRDPRVVAKKYAELADRHLSRWTRLQTIEELQSFATDFGFYLAPVRTIVQSLNDEQLRHRGAFSTLSEEKLRLRHVRPPWRLRRGATATQERGRAPWTGSTEPSRPLAGLRVLDLSWVWSGPMVTAALADLGADVIKVEHYSRPDPARLRGRAIVDGVVLDGPELEVTPYFNQMNRGKRSVCIDLTSPAGADVILSLAAASDVVVENMRPGALERRGLDFESIAARNPHLVMLSMSMAGSSGPGRSLGGYAPVMSGLAGLDAVVGYGANELIGLYNPAIGDPNAAAHALTVLLACLYARRSRPVEPTWIDISQIEALLGVMRGPLIQAQLEGTVHVPANSHQAHRPHGTYRCRGHDAWVSVAARTDAEITRLSTALGVETHRAEEVEAALRQWCTAHERDDAVLTLRGLGLAVAPVQSFEELRDSEWIAGRQLISTPEHPYLGPQPVFITPWKCDGGPVFGPQTAAPLLGEHTSEVLIEVLALNSADLARLHDQGAIGYRHDET